MDKTILYLKCINCQICGHPVLHKCGRSCNIENLQDPMSCVMKTFSQRLPAPGFPQVVIPFFSCIYTIMCFARAQMQRCVHIATFYMSLYIIISTEVYQMSSMITSLPWTTQFRANATIDNKPNIIL